MAAGSAIKAGQAFVSITADDSELQIGLKKMQARIKSFAGTATKIGASLTAMGGAVIGLAAMTANKFAAAGDKLDKMAARTKMSVESLGELKFAAEQSGASIETVETAVRAMQRQIVAADIAMQKLAEKGNLDDVSEEAKNASNALRAVGITLGDLQGLSPEQQFEKIAEALQSIKDDSLRSGAAMQIFGKSGTQLLPMLGNMKELRAEAQRLGIVMSKDQTDAAAALTDAMNRVRRVYDAIINQIGTELAPMIIDFADTLAINGRAVIDLVKDNKDLIITVVKLGAILSVAGGGFIAIAAAAYGVSKTIGVVSSGIALLNKVAASTAITMGAVVGALIALTAVYAIAIKASDEYATALGKTSDYAQKAMKEEQKLQQEDKLRMERLQQLSEKTKLNNQEQSEAADLVRQLTSRYGDLGISIDTTTGKITGMSAAQGKLNQQMRQAQIEKMKAALAEQKLNVRNIQREIDERAGSGQIIGKNSVVGNFLTGNQDKLARAIEKQDVERQKMYALQNEIRALESGTNSSGSGSTGDALQQRINAEKSAALKSRKEIEDAEKRLADFRESASRRHRSDTENETADLHKEGAAYEEILQKLRDTATARGEIAKAAEYELEIAQVREETEQRIYKMKKEAMLAMQKEQEDLSGSLDNVFSSDAKSEAKRQQDEEIDKTLRGDKGAGLDMLSQLINGAMVRAAQAREQTEAKITEYQSGGYTEDELKDIKAGEDAAREAKARQRELEERMRQAQESLSNIPALEIRGTSASFGSAAGLAVGMQTSDQQFKQKTLKAQEDAAEYTRRTYEELRDNSASGVYQ